MLFDALIGTALDLGTMGLITATGGCEGAQIRPQEKASIRLKLAMGAALVLFFGLAGEWMGYRFLHGPGGRGFSSCLLRLCRKFAGAVPRSWTPAFRRTRRKGRANGRQLPF
jgi:hypothetical protein